MTDILFPFLRVLGPFKKYIFRIKWDNLEKVKQVRLPTLFLSGEQDKLIPAEMTRKLFSASVSIKKDIWIVEKAAHNLSLIHI